MECYYYFRLILILTIATDVSRSNLDARRLYDQLFLGYNPLIRPAKNATDKVIVRLKLEMSQLIDVVEKAQILTTMVWLHQEWFDYNLVWDPQDFGGVDYLHIPADMLWTPDIVLYNNADGNYEVSIINKAIVSYNGTIVWKPPAIFNSMCQIHVRWFPFDEQHCEMKFGSWTYDGNEVELQHYDNTNESIEADDARRYVTKIKRGIDVGNLVPSAEWDVMAVPSERHVEHFTCCPAPYIDITYTLSIRRKTLFYTINLIIPSVAISFLTILVFYLPSDSGEKVVLSISILISLTVFFLLLVEIIPSTSLDTPLIGMYLLFTMVIVCCSVAVTVVSLNVHYRTPTTYKLHSWMRKLFIEYIPRFLCMKRPKDNYFPEDQKNGSRSSGSKKQSIASLALVDMLKQRKFSFAFPAAQSDEGIRELLHERDAELCDNPMQAAVDGVVFVAEHFRQQTEDDEVKEDWQYIAQVLDRMFLYVFTITCLIGTCVIILTAPAFYDFRPPIEF